MGHIMISRNIVLIGYMGSGKTSLGKKIAKIFKLDFVDTDDLIVKKEKMSISEIFALHGEEYFRETETEILKSCLNYKNTVIATGGGAPLREANRKILKKAGSVIFLRTTPETTAERLKGDSGRPLLADSDILEKSKKMLAQRMPAYMECADAVIDTDGKSFYKLINEITPLIQNKSKIKDK
jgi:shikimate kinase